MTDLNRLNSTNLDAVRADGVAFPANRDGLASTYGVTLASGTTYYFPLGAQHAPVPAEVGLNCIGMRWDAAIVITTFTFEDTVWPLTVTPQDPRGAIDVSDFDAVLGNWMPENPPGAYISGSGTGGLTATLLSGTVAGGTVGGTTIHLGNFGAKRGRIKVIVGGTGGKVRLGVHGKGW